MPRDAAPLSARPLHGRLLRGEDLVSASLSAVPPAQEFSFGGTVDLLSHPVAALTRQLTPKQGHLRCCSLHDSV